jgi:hypothetical protein
MPKQFGGYDQGRQRQEYQRDSALEARYRRTHPWVERHGNCTAAIGIRAVRFDGTAVAGVRRRPVMDNPQLVIYFAAFKPCSLRTFPRIAILMETKPGCLISIGTPL